MSRLADHAMRRAVVVGAGPSGFYASANLLADGFSVDLIDALPTPFGLVRAGVAPDHPKIKSVTRIFEEIAGHPQFRFYGGVKLGESLSRQDLLSHYHVLVYAMGTARPRRLGIPGEDRAGSHAASDFVAWYNGHPDFVDREFDLSISRAVVVGNGNVALDVARMLVLGRNALATTDAADHAIHGLGNATVSDVIILGRRGPVDASFTTPELRELGRLDHVCVVVDPTDIETAALGESPSPAATRNLDVLRAYATAGRIHRPRRIEFRFFGSPVEVLGHGDGRVSGLRVMMNEVVDGRAVPTGEEETIACGLVVSCVGYMADPTPGVPFDHARGVIRNAGGRVLDKHGIPTRGEYAVGWIKRGPSGVIGTNKKDAAETCAAIAEDARGNRLNRPPSRGSDGAEEPFCSRGNSLVSWHGWRAIDAEEISRGRSQGRPRVKLLRVPEMVALAEGMTGGIG
jgi:ferredoxin--NADP+ reductase